MEYKISIAIDFSETPGARYYKDGPKSGQEFYETLLLKKFEKAQKAHAKLVIDLDGTDGYATSFLDEAFRSLAEKFGAQNVWDNIILISQDEPDWLEEIKSYIFQN